MLHFLSRGSMPPNDTNKLFALCKYSQLSKFSLNTPPPPEPRNEIIDTPLCMKLPFFSQGSFKIHMKTQQSYNVCKQFLMKINPLQAFI